MDGVVYVKSVPTFLQIFVDFLKQTYLLPPLPGTVFRPQCLQPLPIVAQVQHRGHCVH